MLTPLTNKRFTDRILAQLKEYILAHRIQRGERLPSESDLAEIFSVSRGTIREALHILEHDGIVQIKKGPGGGIFLSDGNLLQLIDSIFFTLRWEQVSFPTLMEARKSLEDRIARLAALRADDKDRAEIEKILEKMESAGRDPGLFVQYDTDFHVALAKAAKNKILLLFMVAIKELHNRVVDYSKLHESLFPVAINYHREIWKAVKHGDPEKAAEVMADHLEYFEKHFEQHLGNGSPLSET